MPKLSRTAAALSALSVAAIAVPTIALAAANTEKPTGGTIASFTLSGELKGKSTAPKLWDLGYTLTQAGCEKTVNKTSFNIFFYNVKLDLGGHPTSLNGGFATAAVMLNVTVAKYGNTESLADPTPEEATQGTVEFSVYAGHTYYTWATNSGSAALVSGGSLTTNASGTGGSLTATLVPSGTGSPDGVEGHATSTLTIKGHWSSCIQFK
jgi:hypothetical protein